MNPRAQPFVVLQHLGQGRVRVGIGFLCDKPLDAIERGQMVKHGTAGIGQKVALAGVLHRGA